jgi:hypothetical protein
MNLVRTEENRERVDAKFTDKRLDIDETGCTYLKGLSWGLELEIMSWCSLCLVMPSGFAEALWMARRGSTLLVDPPPTYVARAFWNGVPFFGLSSGYEAVRLVLSSHSAASVLRRIEGQGLLPLAPSTHLSTAASISQ